MIKKKTIEYVDFTDIQQEIAKELGIKYFRDWQLNGTSVDLNFLWEFHIQQNMEGIQYLDISLTDFNEILYEVISEYGKDIVPFINAVCKVLTENKVKYIKY